MSLHASDESHDLQRTVLKSLGSPALIRIQNASASITLTDKKASLLISHEPNVVQVLRNIAKHCVKRFQTVPQFHVTPPPPPLSHHAAAIPAGSMERADHQSAATY